MHGRKIPFTWPDAAGSYTRIRGTDVLSYEEETERGIRGT